MFKSLPFVAVSASIAAKVNPCTLAIYVALRTFHNSRTGRCFPSQSTVACRAKVSLRTAQKAIAKLSECGAILIHRKNKRTSSYSFSPFKNFIAVPLALLSCIEKPNQLAVCVAVLQSVKTSHSCCNLSLQQLALLSGLRSKAVVRRTLNELHALGVVCVQHKLGKPSEIFISSFKRSNAHPFTIIFQLFTRRIKTLAPPLTKQLANFFLSSNFLTKKILGCTNPMFANSCMPQSKHMPVYRKTPVATGGAGKATIAKRYNAWVCEQKQLQKNFLPNFSCGRFVSYYTVHNPTTGIDAYQGKNGEPLEIETLWRVFSSWQLRSAVKPYNYETHSNYKWENPITLKKEKWNVPPAKFNPPQMREENCNDFEWGMHESRK